MGGGGRRRAGGHISRPQPKNKRSGGGLAAKILKIKSRTKQGDEGENMKMEDDLLLARQWLEEKIEETRGQKNGRQMAIEDVYQAVMDQLETEAAVIDEQLLIIKRRVKNLRRFKKLTQMVAPYYFECSIDESEIPF